MADSTKLRRAAPSSAFLGAARGRLPRWATVSGAGLLGALSSALGVGTLQGAQASEAPPAEAPAPAAASPQPGAGAGCKLAGVTEPPKNLTVYDRPSGGRAVARLTGGALRLLASDFPAQPGGALSAVSVDPDGFHVTGYADTSKLQLFARHRLPVVPDHVWIASRQPLAQLAARAGELHVQAQVMSAVQQTFTVWAPCSALSLEPATAGAADVPPSAAEGDRRLYVTRPEAIQLFPEPGTTSGAPLLTITRSGWSDGLVLRGDREKNGLLHVIYDAELFIDAWVRKTDVKSVPKGELVDQLLPARKLKSSSIKLSGEPVVYRAKSRLDLRLGAQRDASAVGAIEGGTEFYVIDRVTEWARVLPKSLVLTAPDGDPFWVLAADLDSHAQKAGG